MKQIFRDWFDRHESGHWKLLFWLILCLISLFLLGNRAAHAGESVLRVHAPSGDQWVCHPRNQQLICDADLRTQPNSTVAASTDRPAPVTSPVTSSAAPSLLRLPPRPTLFAEPVASPDLLGFFLKMLCVGLPVSAVMWLVGRRIKHRYRQARLKSFVEQLERIWQQSAQH